MPSLEIIGYGDQVLQVETIVEPTGELFFAQAYHVGCSIVRPQGNIDFPAVSIGANTWMNLSRVVAFQITPEQMAEGELVVALWRGIPGSGGVRITDIRLPGASLVKQHQTGILFDIGHTVPREVATTVVETAGSVASVIPNIANTLPLLLILGVVAFAGTR